MSFATYADLLRIRDVRRVLLLALVLRMPQPAAGVVITLHVVGHLHRTYAEAGVVATMLALAMAVGNPWRGRLLDRLGLRRGLRATILVNAVVFSVAPWVGYWPLAVLVGIGGLFAVPAFSSVRQVLLHAAPPGMHTAVLSADAAVTEVAFMAGPVLGVLGATYLSTSWSLLLVQWVGVLGGCLLWLADPPLSDGTAATGRSVGVRAWLTPGTALLLLGTLTASLILVCADLSTVAAMRSFDRTALLGLVMAMWALGSLLGALVYGALRTHPPMAVMLVLLAVTTGLVAVSPGPLAYMLLLLVSGFFVAPTLTASSDDLTRLVPASVRGEVMGWQGSSITVGAALGAPVTGMVIDTMGWPFGLLLGGGLGLVIAALVLVAHRRLPRPAGPAGGAAA